MTCGIYMLTFGDIGGPVYIGQSVNIENRFVAHKSCLNKGHYNYKIAEAYTTYGMPRLDILQECASHQLDMLEIAYIEEFNACNLGLNIAEGGASIITPKYSRNSIIIAMQLLMDPTKLFKEIAEIAGISINSVSSISNGSNHLWLSEEFPEEYRRMRSNTGNRKQYSAGANNKGITYKKVISSDGRIVQISNISQFCLDEFNNKKDNSNMCALLKGKKNTHKGWKLYNG